MNRILSTLILSLIMVIGLQAKTITGTVSSKTDNSVLPGAQVRNGNKAVITTDVYGKYSIEAEEGDVLEFSFIGYLTQKVAVGKKNVISVALEEQAQELDEVVVTGYASQKRVELVGSVAGVSVRNAKQSNVRVRGVGAVAHTSFIPRPADAESYASVAENSFLYPLKDPLSTFAADVDVASYNTIKRFIKAGAMPPEDAVRVEEMINYFAYAVEAPKTDPVNIMTELTQAPWNRKHQLLRVSLKAKNMPTEQLPASNFVFLIDVSGSMSDARKLPLVKSSYKMLVDQLRPTDKVAIVTYAGQANVVLESTTGDRKMKIKEVIDALEAGGGTAGGDGLKMAYKIARQHFIKGGNNRVIMATDGDFNVGASSDNDMEKLISKERESNINISILGYGMGNYKDSKLETLADKGRGNYGYVNDISEARKAIVNEFGGTLFTVAKDVKIQVEFNPKFVQAYRLVGYENRLLAAEDFNNDAKVGGDMGVGHTVTALYEIVPVGVVSTIIGSVDPLKYQKNEVKPVATNAMELATVKFRYKDPQGEKSKLKSHVVSTNAVALSKVSQDLQFATAVAELGMLLRNSAYKQDADFDSLIKRAKAAKGKDEEGYRAEFIRVAEDAQALLKSMAVVSNQ